MIDEPIRDIPFELADVVDRPRMSSLEAVTDPAERERLRQQLAARESADLPDLSRVPSPEVFTAAVERIALALRTASAALASANNEMSVLDAAMKTTAESAVDAERDVISTVEARLKALRPLLAEYRQLEAAAAALAPEASRLPASRGVARRSGTYRRSPASGRAARVRMNQALELVEQHPGITIPELAEHMGVRPSYVLRLLPRLVEEGRVRQDVGWHPV